MNEKETLEESLEMSSEFYNHLWTSVIIIIFWSRNARRNEHFECNLSYSALQLSFLQLSQRNSRYFCEFRNILSAGIHLSTINFSNWVSQLHIICLKLLIVVQLKKPQFHPEKLNYSAIMELHKKVSSSEHATTCIRVFAPFFARSPFFSK